MLTSTSLGLRYSEMLFLDQTSGSKGQGKTQHTKAKIVRITFSLIHGEIWGKPFKLSWPQLFPTKKKYTSPKDLSFPKTLLGLSQNITLSQKPCLELPKISLMIPSIQEFSNLTQHFNYLGNIKSDYYANVWVLPTWDYNLITLECGLGFWRCQSFPGDSNVWPNVESTAPGATEILWASRRRTLSPGVFLFPLQLP